ncbi:MAG: transposase [Burkholderiaceae bacterium]
MTRIAPEVDDEPPPDPFDGPWKMALGKFFPEFLVFFFPDIHEAIDWSRGHAFLDKELHSVVRRVSGTRKTAGTGSMTVDKLVRVHRKQGGEQWIYVHIEVQASRKTDFAKRRMFVYHGRLFERFGQPVASLAVLADASPGWRPDGYGHALLGCSVQMRFPMVKLLDWADDIDGLLADPNPFAIVVAAHLLTRRTRGRPRQRQAAKRRLVRLLYERGWSRLRVVDLFGVLDWMMTLSEADNDRLWQDIEAYEEGRKMRFITSVERIGIRKGIEQGVDKGRGQILLEQLSHRFGSLPEVVVARVESGSSADVGRWARRVLDARRLDDVFAEDA